METTHSRGSGRQHQPTTIPTTTQPLPRLMRSRSGAPAMSLPENHACNINNSFNSTSQRFVNNRSKSTTRTRNQKNNNNEENVNPSSMQKKEGSKDGFVRFLQRGSGPRTTTTTTTSAAAAKNNNKVTKSVTNSPSAWALSPGRNSPCMVAPESTVVTSRVVKVKSSGGGGGGGVSGVLKYFRQKKVSPIQEEEYRNFRVVHNRLVQYRFANARAEATMASLNNVAQKKLFSGWLTVLKMRNLILEKQIQVEKLKHEIKLCQIVNPQMRLLNEWAKIEGKNFEAVGRVTRKLSAISVKIPFDDDTKADLESVYKAMSTAVQVMNGIEETITKFFPQAEKILYMVTELASTLEQEDEYLKELDTIIPQIPTLLEKEKYLRVHLIQATEESI